MAGHGPAPTIAAVERQMPPRHHPHAPDRGRGLGRRGADPAVRRRFVAVRALGQRCQPLGPPPRPPHHRPLEGRRPRPLLPRVGRRGDRDAGTRRRASCRSAARSGRQVDVARTTRVVEFNDVDGLEAALADGDVAAVLIEPALTNVGIVLPEPGYLDAVREITRRTGTLLIIDETHTICAGPGGATGAWGLEPDMLVIGKTIGGGIPSAAYGFSPEVAARIRGSIEVEDSDVGGIGGTLAGYALSLGGHPGDARRGPDRRGLRADDPARRALGGGRRTTSSASAACPGT